MGEVRLDEGKSGNLRRVAARRLVLTPWADHPKGSDLPKAPNRGTFGPEPSAIWAMSDQTAPPKA